ncbi:MAG: beta-galactosidase trimerization domain-containing protein [Lentisphaeria bacterium]|nr:beta-galactosidase trimerization domain-containing protein [Lentisphaeria bacterium]
MSVKHTLAVLLLGLGGVCAASSNVKLPDIVLPNGEQAVSKTVKFPAIKKVDGQTAVLKFRLFFDRNITGGWNNTATMALNGQQLTRFTAAGEERLLRRGRNMLITDGTVDWWNKSSGLLTMFGPGKGEVDSRIIAPREEGFWYYLDISDIVNYIELGLDDRIESAVENVFQLNNGLTKALAGRTLDVPLTFKDAEIIYINTAKAAKLRPAQPLAKVTPAATVASISNGNFKVSATKAGGLVIERNGEKYFYSAAFSYPAKGKMKFDRLSAGVSKNRAGWNPVIAKKGNSIIISAATADRKVVRTIKFNKDGLLEIADAITNLSQQDMGVYSFFNVTAQTAIKPTALYMAGMQSITAETGVGANPTLYIQGKKSGFGAMAVDDAFRCHLELAQVAGNSAELRNPAGIKPGETYTQTQLVMLTSSNDYFEFINTLRRNLNMNRTLDGPISLGVRQHASGVQLRIGTGQEWFEYSSKKEINMPRSEYMQIYNTNREKFRKSHPDLKLLVKMEMSPHMIDLDKVKDGHLLPKSGAALQGKYGEIISKKATEIIEKNTPFGDSILRAADGRAIVDMYYPNGNENVFSLLVYTYKNNAYEQKILEQIKWLIKEGGVDGIYIDQFANGTMYPMTIAKDRTSYERWDGRSVVLNPDGTIKMKVFDIGYACGPSRARIIRQVLDRGKVFLANTQPVTSSEAEAGGLRFYETDCENLGTMLMGTGKPGTFRHQAFAQMSPSPMLLGTRPGMFTKDNRNFAKILNRAFICGLRHGLLYIHYSWSNASECYGFINYMFPITPEELGEGFVIGKERILTAVSRKFTVDVKPHTIVAFDDVGKTMDVSKVATVKALKNGKYEVDVKLNDWNNTCAIVLEGPATPADEAAQKAEAAKKKVIKNNRKYPKVLIGPTRSSKYTDPQAEEIGNVFRFYTRTGQGLPDRIRECIKNKTPFIIQEIIDRKAEQFQRPAEKFYDGNFMKPEVIADLLKEAGDLYLGREIIGEFGGMVYWPENSVVRVYGKLKPAGDLAEARKNYYDQLKRFSDKDRAYGGGPFLSVCSCMSFPPITDQLFDTYQLEMMPGDPERLASAFRGVSRAYNKKHFNTLIAHGWYGGATWDELFFKRFQNALNFAYMSGFSAIFSESGHFGWPFYGYNIRREDPRAKRFRKIMKDFKDFCEVDERPTGGPETPMAFMQGHLDGWPGLWAYNVWGQFTPDFAVGEPEQGWKLTEDIYRKSTWFNHDNLGSTDKSGQPPCGMYDVIPADIPQDKLNKYKLIVIPGWNTMTDELYNKLCKYVENGGTLVMTLAQMRTNIKRNEPMKLYNNGDFSKLFGVKINGRSPIEITGVKFPHNSSADGKYQWVNWGMDSDAKFSSNGTYRSGQIVENKATALAVCSKNFTASEDKKDEQVPILLEHKLGKGYAFFINSEKFPGHPALYDFMRYVTSVLMRGEQPAGLNVTATEGIRYAVYGKSIYVTNTDSDFDGFFVLNGKKYQLKPQQLLHIER